MKKYLELLLIVILITGCRNVPNDTTYIISNKQKSLHIYLDEDIDPLILWAVNDLADDIKKITGSRPEILKSKTVQKGKGIYIGEFKNSLIKSLNKKQVNSLNGEWEKFHINVYQENLIIAGSDVRGTVYGIFEIAKRLGISPWKWWADVKPISKDELVLNINEKGITENPSVQYRGIFLNDEDWGLQPWAAKTFETETGDIGPKTYEKIFQLLLRLKANTIWPAMHPSTKAFFRISGNKEMAEKYHILIGTSHAEPMLRNNVDEWDEEAYGEFNYFTNSEKVKEYWQKRISDLKKGDNIITMGMRGIHDSGMEGNATKEEKVQLLEKIIFDQREMLTQTINKPLEEIPQVLTLYKEVLNLYNDGVNIPDDVTLMWTDDNYGYIRKLSNKEEQQRIGGSGVYYHLSYWGRPHDYLWLSTTQPGLIWYEMSRAYQNGARKIWIANVGDIKPSEYNMEFFLDLAWDVNSVNNTNIDQHMTSWASREFGEDLAHDVTQLMKEYYRLAFLRRPEFMGWNGVEPQTKSQMSQFSSNMKNNELKRRISMYKNLFDKLELLTEKVPENRLDAWFQLIEYPVKGAVLMNYKFLYAQLAKESTDTLKSREYAEMSQHSFQQIKQLTAFYNKDMSSGKWDNMMCMSPRNLDVFSMPNSIIKETDTITSNLTKGIKKQIIFIQGNEYNAKKEYGNYTWETIKGLGYSNNAVTLHPFDIKSFHKEEHPSVDYTFEAKEKGAFELQVRCLPTHSNNFDHQIGIQIDKNEIQYFSLNTKGRSNKWKENVLRNSQIIKQKFKIEQEGKHIIRLYVNQTGIVIDQLAIDFALDEHFYEIPIK